MDSASNVDSSNIQAEGNSIAIGAFSVGGNTGDIHIGHTIGFTSDQVSTLITQISSTFQPKPFDVTLPHRSIIMRADICNSEKLICPRAF